MKGKHILIIEDERDIADLLQFNLEQKQYSVSIARNGENGIEIAKNKKPDLVLLDLMLPGIHGLDVCRILKTKKGLEKTSIIMLTALGQEENIVKGLEAGADDYISKPFSFNPDENTLFGYNIGVEMADNMILILKGRKSYVLDEEGGYRPIKTTQVETQIIF